MIKSIKNRINRIRMYGYLISMKFHTKRAETLLMYGKVHNLKAYECMDMIKKIYEKTK